MDQVGKRNEKRKILEKGMQASGQVYPATSGWCMPLQWPSSRMNAKHKYAFFFHPKIPILSEFQEFRVYQLP